MLLAFLLNARVTRKRFARKRNAAVHAQGKPVGVIDNADTIQLSSFRGKKPVCLIMSSYT